MNKNELIDKVVAETSMSKADATKVMEAFLNNVQKTLSEGGTVALTGFGTFSVSERAARMGVNPQNPSEKIEIPAVKVPKFKAGKTLKDAVR
jgi:DNA-binding protein HU-beta